MARDSRLKQSPKQNQMRARIAAAAARIMAEDGVDDFALAKRKAARQLGATDTHALPGNDEVEAELRAYLALYRGDEQRERIAGLRELALAAMRELEPFRPYLSGGVLKGTASRNAEIDLQLFTDDLKSVEIFLMNRGVAYDVSEQRDYCGDEPRAVSLLHADWDGVPVNLAVHGANDERSVLKATLMGRPIERAGIAAVQSLIEANGASS